MRNRPPHSGSPRILLIDDNRAIHEDFRKVLSPDPQGTAENLFLAAEAILLGETAERSQRPAFEIDSAYQGREGVEIAQKAVTDGRPYSMAFVDMRMPPGWDGLETIEHLWAIDPHIQVVICSAHSDYDWFDVVGRLGHSDQLLVLRKPFEPIEAVQCATALVRKWQNEQAMRSQVESLEQAVTVRTQGLEAANQELRHLATHDALTGLPNRVLLDDRLDQAVAHAERYGKTFALMLCDLDRFKLINDSMGHGAGDQLLQEVARRLTSVVRNIDTVARIGGDEFVIVLSPPANAADAEDVARRALETMQPPVEIGGISIHASPSIGIAYFPADATTVQSLIAHADAAMYAAKQVGRNKVQSYAPGMNAGTQEKVRLESELHTALAMQQFELHFQPKIDIRTGAVNSAEALVRWRHPQRGLIPPANFIPLAEECGLIGRIGDWVVREACRQGRAWQDDGLPRLRIAVNLSASQFRARYLVETIRSALADANFEPRSLEVEITESTVMSDPEESIRTLERLSEMGVLISVDDFGTGYSSMGYLRRLPIDKLKIDRSFINEITARADDASIVQAIVSLAHSLNLKVIAEGVETTAQLDFLKSIGCDQYQGYHFSQPLPAREFAALMRGIQVERAAFTEADALSTHSKLAAYKRTSTR
ncbi:MAG: putative bifunctional diguanylate cyclase/phosphodiesterase [Steroidobacterales bacterium]